MTTMVSSSLPEEGVNLKEYLSELEVNLIKQALDNQDWVVARAADKLGMRRTTLVEKMRKYDIQRTEDVWRQVIDVTYKPFYPSMLLIYKVY